MEQDRIMILGANGQVGQALRHVWDTLPEHPGWSVGWFDREQFDMTDPASLRDAMKDFAPHLVIHSAGYTDIDGAQDDELAAIKTNFHATAHLAAQCAALDAKMIYISSVHVFDGTQTESYRPEDPMNPINQYGASKMMAEESLRHELPWHVILRTAAVFSPYGRNIMTSLIEDIKAGRKIHAPSDWTLSPTPALDLARAIFSISETLLAGKVDGFGTYHYAGAPACSRYELSAAIAAALEVKLGLRARLEAALAKDLSGKAPRPAFGALDSSKAASVFGLKIPDWREGIEETVSLL